MTKVALFTSFSPDIGGGATNLRSVIPHFEGVDVRWLYLGSAAKSWTCSRLLGPKLMGRAGVVRDVVGTGWMWGFGQRAKRLMALAEAIQAENADVNWIVAHNEGVLVGNLLRRLAPGKKLHVSVHDDPEMTTFARSRRYRFYRHLARRPFETLLRAATSIDVTSDGMQEYYRTRYGLKTTVVHPYVAKVLGAPSNEQKKPTFTLGQLGAVYDREQFGEFLKATRQWCARKGSRLHVVLIGSGNSREIESALGDATVEKYEHLAEPDAIAMLQRCDAVHAMYPFSRRGEIFRVTSFPTKLSTYVSAARPIIAHTPLDSSMADVIRRYDLGVVIDGSTPADIGAGLDRLTARAFGGEAFERARSEIYGVENVRRLMGCLCG